MTQRQLGRYEIIGELGKGAMGLVYLARDPIIGRQLALKTFRLGFSAKDADAEQFKARFLREAQSAGILNHPNIVTIHDVVVDDGGDFFIAMEYVKGTDLKQLMQRQGRLDIRFVVDLIAQIADGLDYAHSKGVVHRDIKPANIIITADKQAKITDFGIARVDASNLTVEGQLLGTPNYMAPEQIQGKEVDHRADLFSLGVMLYEMTTGKKPFQGDNLTMVTHRIVYDAFTPPQELVAGLPDRLVSVLQRALEKDVTKRYDRGSEMARDLRAVFTSSARPGRGTASFLAPPDAPTSTPSGGSRTGASASVSMPSSASTPYPISGNSGSIRTGTLAGVPAPTPTPPAPQPAAGRSNRVILGTVAALVVAALLMVAYVALRPAAGPDPAQQVDPQAELMNQTLPLLRQGKQALEDGEPLRAMEFFDRALVILPGDKEIRGLREQAEQMIAAGDLTLEEAQLQDRLRRARLALEGDQYDQAVELAQQALELEPKNEDGLALIARAEAGKQRLRNEKGRVQDRFTQRPLAPGSEPAAGASQPPATTTAPAAEATLKVEFFSEVSDGVLNVYVGSRKFFTERFSFTTQSGGLIKRQVASSGRLTYTDTLEAGNDVKLRVYVWSGNKTRTHELNVDFPADSERTLDIRVAADGMVSVRMQ